MSTYSKACLTRGALPAYHSPSLRIGQVLKNLLVFAAVRVSFCLPATVREGIKRRNEDEEMMMMMMMMMMMIMVKTIMKWCIMMSLRW